MQTESTPSAKKIVVGGNHGVNYLSLVTVVATLAVVFMHTNNCFWTFSTDPYWITADFIDAFFVFAVPCFLMISGATLIGYRDRYSTKTFFVKRFKKTVIPFLVWSILAFVYLVLRHRIDLGNYSIRMFVDALLGSKFFGLYWFFPMLFVVYLCMPLFSAVSKDLRKSVFSYLVLVTFVCNAAIPLAIDLLGIELAWPFVLPVTGSFLVYPLIGYLIHNYDVKPGMAKGIYAAGIVGFLLMFIGTYVLSNNAGEVVSTFKDGNGAPYMMYAAAVFLFFKRHHGILSRARVSKVVGILAPYGFSVYLMHWFFLDFIFSCCGNLAFSLGFRLIVPFVVTALCIAIAWVIKKIPGLRAILP